MTDTEIEQLERLTQLRAAGTLSDAEFVKAKSALLAGGSVSSVVPRSPTPSARSTLSPTWQFRFDFLSEYGLPHTTSYQQAYRTLPFGQKMRLTSSALAFFFGPIYFLILGLWKAALSILGGSIVYGIIIIAISLPPALDRVAWMVPAVIYMTTCVPLYYLKQTQRIDSWNPFFWRQRA